MHDLISSIIDIHYENHRIMKVTAQGKTDDDTQGKARKAFERTMKEEEEALRKRFTEQVRSEEARFRAWEQKVGVHIL